MQSKPDTFLRDAGLFALMVILFAAAKLWAAEERGDHYVADLIKWGQSYEERR